MGPGSIPACGPLWQFFLSVTFPRFLSNKLYYPKQRFKAPIFLKKDDVKKKV